MRVNKFVNKIPIEIIDKIYSMRISGAKLSEISNELGINVNTISRRCKMMHIDKPNGFNY